LAHLSFGRVLGQTFEAGAAGEMRSSWDQLRHVVDSILSGKRPLHVMQRLFSGFATGGPGVGLLVLRLGSAAQLLSVFQGAQDAGLGAAVWCLGTVIAVGLVTPLGSAACAAVQLFFALQCSTVCTDRDILLAFPPLALAFLGPGGYSVDRLIFGRKLIFQSGRADARSKGGRPYLLVRHAPRKKEAN
jgi:hypothetical protein